MQTHIFSAAIAVWHILADANRFHPGLLRWLSFAHITGLIAALDILCHDMGGRYMHLALPSSVIIDDFRLLYFPYINSVIDSHPIYRLVPGSCFQTIVTLRARSNTWS